MPDKWDQYAVKPAAQPSDVQKTAADPWEKYAVPAAPAQGDNTTQDDPSLLGRATKLVDRLSTVTPQDEAGHGRLFNAAQKFGAGAIGASAGALLHPVQAATGFMKSIEPDTDERWHLTGAGIGESLLGPVGPMLAHTAKAAYQDPAGTAGGIVGGTLLGEAGGGLVRGVGKGTRMMAPKFAEAAMKTQPMDRTFGRNDPGRTPGEALLRETKGSDPGAIAQQAQERVTELNKELEQNALNSPHKAALGPARLAASDFGDQAVNRGNPSSVRKIQGLQDHLTKQIDPATGSYDSQLPIPNDISPRYLLDLKRGIGERGKSWLARDPAELPDTAVSRVYHLLDEEGDRTIPGGRELNERMASLLPVAKRAGAVDLNAGILQKAANRLATPTGALAPAAAGAYFGGPLGAAAGLVLPEVMTAPRTVLRAARLMDAAPVTAPKIPIPLPLRPPTYGEREVEPGAKLPVLTAPR